MRKCSLPAAAASWPQLESGAAPFEASPLMVKYQIGRRLSAGKYGTVYLVSDRRSGEERALKVIDARLTSNGPQPVNPMEVYYMAKVEHPCVVRLLDAVVQPFRVLVLMEYFPGEALLKISQGTSDPATSDAIDEYLVIEAFNRSQGSLNEVPPSHSPPPSAPPPPPCW